MHTLWLLLLVYLPVLLAPPAPANEAEASQQALALWQGAPWQERAEMVVDPVLAEVAKEYAYELIDRLMDNENIIYDDPALNISERGVYANQRVRMAGYVLPAHYPDRGNWVQTSRFSQVSIRWTLYYLVTNPLEHERMTGAGLYANHTHVGVWVAFASEGYARAYVFVSAPESGAE